MKPKIVAGPFAADKPAVPKVRVNKRQVTAKVPSMYGDVTNREWCRLTALDANRFGPRVRVSEHNGQVELVEIRHGLRVAV